MTTVRDNITAFLKSSSSQNLASIPWTYALDGFTWTADFVPSFNIGVPDSNNIGWWKEFGGYDWSYAKAATNNGTEYVRFEVRPGDTDIIVTGAERAERGGEISGTTKIAVGGFFSVFGQIYIEAGSANQSSDWLFSFQQHTGAGAAPDLFTLSLLGGNIQLVTQRNGVSTNRGSPVAYSTGTWYAFVAHGFWSGSTTDTFAFYLAANGGTLTQIANLSGSIFETVSTGGAIIKQGLYRGPNGTGAFAIRVANHKVSLTQNAYSSYITTQPALPTHA